MLIGIISDTHDHMPHIQLAVSLFREQEADLVLHAGDYCSPFTIPPFEGLPLVGIYGNNDGDKHLLMKKFREIDAELAGEFLERELDGVTTALYHGTHEGITEALVGCGRYDLVISGHTHEPRQRTIDGTLALNPGTANGFDGRATVALLDTADLAVRIVELGPDL